MIKTNFIGGSMIPLLETGDVGIFLCCKNITTGDIILVGKIAHRVIKVSNREVIIKGDTQDKIIILKKRKNFKKLILVLKKDGRKIDFSKMAWKMINKIIVNDSIFEYAVFKMSEKMVFLKGIQKKIKSINQLKREILIKKFATGK